MDPLPPPLAFVVLLFAGWVNRQQQAVMGLHAHLRRAQEPRHDVVRNTIKAILKDHGIEPAPERGAKTP